MGEPCILSTQVQDRATGRAGALHDASTRVSLAVAAPAVAAPAVAAPAVAAPAVATVAPAAAPLHCPLTTLRDWRHPLDAERAVCSK